MWKVLIPHTGLNTQHITTILHRNSILLYWFHELKLLQTWKLREEGRLLDLVDPELTEYPEAEVLRFIKVALFCIQSSYNQRPNMKQVIDMLSKEVKLNEKLLTKPGVYRPHSSKQSSYGSLTTSSKGKKKGVNSTNHSATTDFHSFQCVSEMIPR